MNSSTQYFTAALLSIWAAVGVPARALAKNNPLRILKKNKSAHSPAIDHSDVLDDALKTHEDYVSEKSSAIQFPALKMKRAVGYVLDHFGSIVAASYKGDSEKWSVTFRKRPPRPGPLGRLFKDIPNGWGLFFDHVSDENGKTRLDLTVPDDLTAFLRDFSAIAESIADDTTVNALFAYVEEAGQAPTSSRAGSNAKVGATLKKRARTRAAKIDEQYADMKRMLDEVDDLYTVSEQGRIYVSGGWRPPPPSNWDQDEALAELAAKREREAGEPPKVVYFFPSFENRFVSGFRGHYLDEDYNLEDPQGRHRFAVHYPELFSRLGTLVLDKYREIKTSRQAFAERAAQFEKSETSQSMKMLSHPAFMIILNSRTHDDGTGAIDLATWTTPKGIPVTMQLESEKRGDGTLQPVVTVWSNNKIVRRITSRTPKNVADLDAIEKADGDYGVIPSRLLVALVQSHNSEIERAAMRSEGVRK